MRESAGNIGFLLVAASGFPTEKRASRAQRHPAHAVMRPCREWDGESKRRFPSGMTNEEDTRDPWGNLLDFAME